MYKTKTDELMHYGVLGMKWGIHRAVKKGQTYTYKSHGQKKYEKKLNNQIKKGESSEKIAKTSDTLSLLKTRDRNRQAYAEKTTVGKTIAKGILLGPIGSGSYNRLRASGIRRGSSAMLAMAGTSIAPTSTVFATRRAEFDVARGENLLKNGMALVHSGVNFAIGR